MVARTPSTAAFALLDCAFHVVWIMYCSCFGVMGSLLATRLGFLDEGLLTLVVFVVSALLVSPVAEGLGGLSMNPANEVALFAAGKMGYVETTVRVPATMIGGTLGAGMLLSVLPNEYVGYIPTPKVKAGATLSLGFWLEFCLSFANNLILLFCLGKPGRLAQSIPLVSVVASIVLFESYTGPMMNPALGWSWGYHFDSLKELETQLVFVGAPILGAMAAGVTWKLLNRERETKRRQGGKKND